MIGVPSTPVPFFSASSASAAWPSGVSNAASVQFTNTCTQSAIGLFEK